MRHADRLALVLEDMPLVRTSALLASGLSKDSIREAVESGLAFRPAQGVLAHVSAYAEPRLVDAVLALVAPGCVIVGETAALRHGLVDAAPAAVEVLVPHATVSLPAVGCAVRLRRTRNPQALTERVDTTEVLGVEVGMTDPVRTVCELVFREAGQSAAQALQTYLDDGGPVDDLLEHADALTVRPEVEARVAAHFAARARSL